MARIVFFYLTSFGASLMGNSITAVALPLLVLFTTGSPLGAGAVAIAAAVPSAIAGILMGSLIDQINRRTAAILSDVISAVALLVLPIVDLTVGLNLGWLIAVAVLNSFGDVPGITAREAMLPAIASASRMDPSRLIGLRESLAGVSLLIGPAIAGMLVASLEPVTVLWITSGTAALAAVLTLMIPARATLLPPDRHTTPRTEQTGSMLRGLVVLFRSSLLRSLVLLGATLAIVLAATQGMVIPVHFAFQGEPQFVGFVLSALAAGLLVGGGIFAAVGSRLSRRAWLTVGLMVVSVGVVTVGLLGPVWSIFAGAAIVGLGSGSMNAVVSVTFIENVDDAERGKVLGAQNALLTLVPALGIGGAAALIEMGSLRTATMILAALWVVVAALAQLNPRLRRLGQGQP